VAAIASFSGGGSIALGQWCRRPGDEDRALPVGEVLAISFCKAAVSVRRRRRGDLARESAR
jgi:hypothetical protein